jgi:hypothetical protein
MDEFRSFNNYRRTRNCNGLEPVRFSMLKITFRRVRQVIFYCFLRRGLYLKKHYTGYSTNYS